MAAQAYVTLDELMTLRGGARGFSLLPHQPPSGALAGRHASRLRGRGLDFAELRRYREGDDIRAMDWLATARTGTPHVRLYAEERDRVVLLVVDQRMTMFFGSRRATKSAVAAQVAALAAWRVIKAGDRIAALVFDDRERVILRPSRRAETVPRILGEIVRLNTALNAQRGAADAAMLNHVIADAAQLASHDWLVVLISDGFGADATTAQRVSTLAAHNDVLAVFVFDALEAELPSLGRVAIAEGESRLSVDMNAARLREGYAADFATRRALVRNYARHRSIPVVDMRTDGDVAGQIRATLQPRRPR